MLAIRNSGLLARPKQEAQCLRSGWPSEIDDPHKNWKLSIADIEERTLWPNYMKAHEQCLEATSTPDAPWHVVPTDDKKNARLIIAEILLDVFRGLKMTYPEPSPERRRELQLIRKTLVKKSSSAPRSEAIGMLGTSRNVESSKECNGPKSRQDPLLRSRAKSTHEIDNQAYHQNQANAAAANGRSTKVKSTTTSQQ